MSIKHVVLDSGVFAKIFLNEEGREDVIGLLKHIGDNGMSVLCPDIFLYEVLSVAALNGFLLADTLTIIRDFEKSYLTIAASTTRQFELAMRMAEDGHEKSGFPSIYDSTFHAVAISYDGVFITADKRHVAKAKQYGNIVLLHEWKSALEQVVLN